MKRYMVRKWFKWLVYIIVFAILLVAGILATAYWNRDTLLDKLTAELNKGINGKFHIDKVDFTFLHNFPNFSITLRGVNLRDSQYEKYKKEILSAKRIFVDVAFYPLLRKELVFNSVSFDDADIFIFKAHNGDTNTDIFKKQVDSTDNNSPATEKSLLFNVEEIDFNNVSFVFTDSTKDKIMSFRFIETEHALLASDSGYNISVAGEVHFDSLQFNPKGGSFLKNKTTAVDLLVHLNTLNNTLAILPSTVTYKKNDFSLGGNFEIKKEGNYNIRFKAANIDPTVSLEILNPKLVNSLIRFRCENPINIEVVLNGISIPGYIPDVDVQFETKDADVHFAPLDFSALSLKGTFTNHVNASKEKDNNNSKVEISYFRGNMEKIPVEGRVTFTELQDPTMRLWFTSKLTHKDVNTHLDNDQFVMEKGTFTTEVGYTGKLSEYLDPTRTRYKGKLVGSIRTSDGSLYYKPKKIRVNEIQLSGSFTEKLFTVEKLMLDINGSPISLNGTMLDFIPFFIRPENKAVIALKVSSPNLDLTSFASPKGVKKKSKQQNAKNRRRMTELLDMVYDRLEFDLDLKVAQLKFRKFSASSINGRMRLNNQLLEANPLSMNVAGGEMKLNFSLDNVFASITPMLVKAQISDANIKDLFLNFNNFNQKTIQSENLRGKISADVEYSANVDQNYHIITPSMRGTLYCKIEDGGLVNFEPLENMSNFLFKKRDFSDVEFAELNSNFSISGTDMDISRMEIQSTVLSLFLEGRYSFTDSTSLSVQIPLSNLKKRHKDFKPKNIGTHAKAGPSIFLHVYREKDINTKIKIDYDPFKKWASK